jgi:hypothetical protein
MNHPDRPQEITFLSLADASTVEVAEQVDVIERFQERGVGILRQYTDSQGMRVSLLDLGFSPCDTSEPELIARLRKLWGSKDQGFDFRNAALKVYGLEGGFNFEALARKLNLIPESP